MPIVLMNFGRYGDAYNCHFIEGDAKTPITEPTRYFHFATLDELDAFFRRCNPADPDELRSKMARWTCGSTFVNLTNEQFAKLKRRQVKQK